MFLNLKVSDIEKLIDNDKKARDKVEAFITKNKPGHLYLSSLKGSIYISRPLLNKLKEEFHSGGFLPLIPILAGIAAAGSVAGGAAGIASAVNKKKAEDNALAEQHRHNISLENAARGSGLSQGGSLKDDVVDFVEKNDLDNDVKRLVKKTLKGLASVIPIRKEGGSLILSPYTGGSMVLRDWK